MKSIERHLAVNKPARLVWDYLSDFRSTNDWDPGTKQTTRESGDGGVGTVYKNVSEFAGNEVEITYTVTEVTPGSSITLAGESKSFTSTDTITVDGSETEARVTYVAEFDFHGLAKLAEPFAGLPLKKLGDDAAEQMQQELEKI
ncbi:SRPBCC family protein [Aeromicrobium sp. 9AM]|uniref:SRPBCC family protein n=1 Tax=Aeromicrobium sp. 9AM TaxID=2653126 RepID=UPI0012F39763|nr:SRPBCC family protein [Aeromicrobium sp. 9AM]VXB33841.1 Carbon monoxide dehydrogenase subunit G [Aeromicrobium sp. 9AM]